ncbi:hypothetical protein [Polyangium sorediatum]|uniref:Uncharacterized protein n=1 Tax=Polyangium sorediatum TaxID=889274 RepID=A0ABT6P617_9BACT|nr:hypothetical protein [Polyangium sorediatum]MDI1436050.1 hypothetical protein [Polyangium sorediatum]
MIALLLSFAWDVLPRRPALQESPRLAEAGERVERVVTEAYITQVVAMQDAAARNLLITQAYGDLSLEIADLLGSGAGINWCTMAAWASRRAGQSIRGEDLPGQHYVARAAARVPGARFLVDTMRDVSREVGEGNREVFLEVAPAFAGFARAFREGDEALAAFFASFTKGPPDRGGQDILRRAFDCYLEAARAPAGKRKAELLYAANLYVALQEQTRLQGRIAAAMPGGPTTRALVTKAMLELELGGGTAIHRLGADLPDGPFGEHLEALEDPELVTFVLRFDADIASTCGSRAERWDALADRMRFIVELFRLHGSDASLFEEPLSAAEWLALTGRVRPRRPFSSRPPR